MKASELKFRCSALGLIMTNSRSKSEVLSETTRTYLIDIAGRLKYGIDEDFESKYTDKGNYCEEDSITLLSKHQKHLFVKNTEMIENEYLTGTPDIVQDDRVIDIKTPWNWRNFIKAVVTKMYEWQLRGYMMLTNVDRAILAYVLTDLPEHLLYDELRRKTYYQAILEGTPEYDEIEQRLRMYYTYERIPLEKRVRLFVIERDKAKEQQLIERIEVCREEFEKIWEEV